MIGTTITHYRIIETLGEVPIRLRTLSLSAVAELSLPASHDIRGRAGILPLSGRRCNL